MRIIIIRDHLWFLSWDENIGAVGLRGESAEMKCFIDFRLSCLFSVLHPIISLQDKGGIIKYGSFLKIALKRPCRHPIIKQNPIIFNVVQFP